MMKLIFSLLVLFSSSFLQEDLHAEARKGDVFIVLETWNEIDDSTSSRIRYLGELRNISSENVTVSHVWVFRDKDNKIIETVGGGVTTVSPEVPDPFSRWVDRDVIQNTKRVDVIIEFFNRGVFYTIPFPESRFESSPDTLSVVSIPSQTLLGDLDADGDVDFADFLIFAENFGKSN